MKLALYGKVGAIKAGRMPMSAKMAAHIFWNLVKLAIEALRRE
jgi:hypothetical protein